MPSQLNLSISRDPEGTYLRASLEADGRTFSSEVKLDPLIQLASDCLRRYHAQLHGGDQVAGLGDWYDDAVRVAKRVAASKAAREVVKQVKAHKGDIARKAAGFVPGGNTLLDVGYKVHSIVSAARKGNEVARGKLAELRKLADSGDAKATAVVQLAREVNSRLAEAETPDTDVGRTRRHHGRADHRNNPARRPPPRRTSVPAPQQTSTPIAQPSPYYDPEPEEPGYPDDGGGEYPEDEVAGWAWNRGYRSASDYLVEASRSPGVGLSLRELYNRGRGERPTDRMAVLNRALRGHPQVASVVSRLAPHLAPLLN